MSKVAIKILFTIKPCDFLYIFNNFYKNIFVFENDNFMGRKTADQKKNDKSILLNLFNAK